MKTAKKISWHAAAIAAALVVSGVANADHRDGGHRNYRGNSHHDWRGDNHRRVWRDYGRHDYRYSDHGYRHHANGRYYYPRDRYYNSYYRPVWPDYGYGATLTFGIPLY